MRYSFLPFKANICFKQYSVKIGFWIILFLLMINTKVFAQAQAKTPLTEPGNDIFGTIQETISALEADTSTNWQKVNIEALRRHLLDMKAFTEQVEVFNKKDLPRGVQFQVHPQNKRAQVALKHLFAMHPAMLKKETGWDMKTELQQNGDWLVSCTSGNPGDVAKIRALGYIGLIAEGAHHQLHHWMIATGRMSYPK